MHLIKLSLRNRIFIGILFIYACAVLFLLYSLLQDIDPRYRESAEDSMVEISHLVAAYVEQSLTPEGEIQTSSLQTLFEAVAKREVSAEIFGVQKDGIELRVYVVDQTGKVLFDSTGVSNGEDFSQWRDIVLTLRGEYGSRTSSDIPNRKETSVMYVSAPINWQGHIIGAVTVGKPIATYGQYISNARQSVLSVGLYTTVALAVLVLIIAIWLTQPLGLVTEYIRYIRSQKSVNLPRLGRRALDLFSQGYENMRDALAGRHYVTDYVQKLTHELKSPLSAIRGAAELLQGPMPEEQRQKFLQNIERESLRVQELVDHMLELTALEQVRSIKNPQSILLPPLLEELVSSAQAIAAKRCIEVVLQLPVSASSQLNSIKVEGDPILLHRALRNLLDNALDFSPDEGVVTIELRLEKRIASIQITDQGPGIPDYAKDRLFEKFYSLTRPSSKKKSSGLGLSFVREITILHHGTVELDNRVDVEEHITGAVATLKLPLAD